MTKELHIVKSGKGGIGKSTVISVQLADYFRQSGIVPDCYNIDPNQNTFGDWEALNVEHISILTIGEDKIERLNENGLHNLCQAIADSRAKRIVIDNGGSSFKSMQSFWLENDLSRVLRDQAGVTDVVIHTMLFGAGSELVTFNGVGEICESFMTDRIVVWDNHYEGGTDVDGLAFSDTTLFADHQNHVSIVRVEEPSANKKAMLRLFFKSRKLVSEFQPLGKLTYKDVAGYNSFTNLSVPFRWQQQIFAELDAVGLRPTAEKLVVNG